jgi:beta-glucuronidase
LLARPALAGALVVLLAALAALTATSATALSPVTGGYGPSGRYSLDGQWLFRLQHRLKPKVVKSLPVASTAKGWSHEAVPGTWNANEALDPHMRGEVAWYRKDFTLPSADPRYGWAVRFQSVNNRVQVWLNGHRLGSHAGPYLPFQLTLPSRLLSRKGVNRLVLRVDSTRLRSDLPGVNNWWNYGGILRPVELQRIRTVGFDSVQVLPELPCPTCAATILWRATVRNYAATPQRVRLRASYGALAVDLGTAVLPGQGVRTLYTSSALPTPRLWSPKSPYLYAARIVLDGNGPHERGWQPLSSYELRSGVRSVAVAPDGTMRLNGEVLNVRGAGLIEDSPQLGAALDYGYELKLITAAKELGATAIRTQYPLDERLEELADRMGIVLWSEVPLDKAPHRLLVSPAFRLKAVGELQQDILANANHPAIVVWSIANELSSRPEAGQGAYIAEASAAAHAMDPTRLVGLAVAGYPSAGCQTAYYAPLDVIGLNDYFGWYKGPHGELADRNGLSAYLDSMHACYPSKAIMVTEFGAEANREGPVTEPGSYAFQQDFVRFHLEVFASKPWLAGAFYWALQEFRVTPGWGGGNPKPTPPMHTKGLIAFYGYRKPAFYEAQRLYQATDQIHPPSS